MIRLTWHLVTFGLFSFQCLIIFFCLPVCYESFLWNQCTNPLYSFWEESTVSWKEASPELIASHALGFESILSLLYIPNTLVWCLYVCLFLFNTCKMYSTQMWIFYKTFFLSDSFWVVCFLVYCVGLVTADLNIKL